MRVLLRLSQHTTGHRRSGRRPPGETGALEGEGLDPATSSRRALASRTVPPTAILYGKPGCHLCDLAEAILERLARSGEVDWSKQNIEADPALFARYRYEIPVIMLEDGSELA